MADVTVEYQGSPLNKTPGLGEYNDGNDQAEVGQQFVVPEGVAKTLASNTDWAFVDADRFEMMGVEVSDETRALEEAAENRHNLDAISNPPVIDYGEGKDTQSGAGDSVPEVGTGSGGDAENGAKKVEEGSEANGAGGDNNGGGCK